MMNQWCETCAFLDLKRRKCGRPVSPGNVRTGCQMWRDRISPPMWWLLKQAAEHELQREQDAQEYAGYTATR